MQVGIPTWDGRVSPALDVAKHFLLVEIANGEEVDRGEADIGESQFAAKVKRISELGVQAPICGAVSWPLKEALAATGVRVIPQTCGPVEVVLRAF